MAKHLMRGTKSEPRGLEPHIYVFSRAESGYISFYTEDDHEDDDADVQDNGTQACHIVRPLTIALEADSFRTVHGVEALLRS
jgi:hypothetical protein